MYRNGQLLKEDNHWIGKAILLITGILIGMSLGLYVAVRTLPLSPPVQYYYLQGAGP